MNLKTVWPALFAVILLGAGCVSDVEKLRRQVSMLVQDNKYDEARAFVLDKKVEEVRALEQNKKRDDHFSSLSLFGLSPRFTPKQREVRKDLLQHIDKKEAEYIAKRTKELRDKVLPNLKKGDDAAARKQIYTFGISGQTLVDAALFLIKTGILNSYVNPASFHRIGETAETACREAIAKGDFKQAMEAYGQIKLVPAYPDDVDTGLDEASAEAVRQRCEKESVEALVASVKAQLYGEIAPRDGYDKTDFVPDWTRVRDQLKIVRDALVNDDFSPNEADELTDMLLRGIKSYFNDHATEEEMTTQVLNDRLSSLRNDLYRAVQEAIKNAAAKAEAAQAAKLRGIAREFAAMVASEIDRNARIGAFIGAIGDRTEPDVNRILGEGARVLRLYVHGEEVKPADATALLAAACYMGFCDVANLALALKADVNGTAVKDSFGRTPYLLALQYGFKSGIKEILANADRRKTDAHGYNALHYAARYGTSADIVDALDFGIDAKAAAKDGVTPLMIAAHMDNSAFVQALIPLSDVNAADAKGFTALHYAIDVGSLPITRMLILAKANPLAKDKGGDAALELAVMRPDEAILAYLLDEVKVDGKNIPPSERAVSWCVIHTKVIPLTTLVAHGAKVTDRHLAAAVVTDYRDDVLDMVKFLVERGCDVNSAEVKAAVGKLLAMTPLAPLGRETISYLRANGFRAEDGTPRFTE